MLADAEIAYWSALSRPRSIRGSCTGSSSNGVVVSIGADHYVALADPLASPPADKVGIFSDGRQHFAAVALTALGKRLFYDMAIRVTTNSPRIVEIRVRRPVG